MTSHKVAIVNRTNLKNFGSVLQVYALCQAVQKLGYESEVVWQRGNMSKNFDIRPNKLLKVGIKALLHPSLLLSLYKMVREANKVIVDPEKVRLFDEFVANNFKQSLYASDELERVASSDEYYKFICGSDQVWATTTLYPDPMMYLRFAPLNKRIAYAPSLGRDYVPSYNKKTIKSFINDIDCVSIREDVGKKLIKELTGRDVPVVADPTLLLRAEEWDSLKANIQIPEHYVLCYFLDEPSDEVKAAICKYVRDNNKSIVALGHFECNDLPQDLVMHPAVGPGGFLTITSNADMVITDSYHGMLFAINYHKKFWSVERAYSQYDQSSRQMTVLSRLGLDERYVKSNYLFTEKDINYIEVQARIDEFVSFSMNYLKTSLEQ